jgi:glycyl-tRNA synthetase beta chain
MNKTLLLEIGTEEIPSRFMPNALECLGRLASEKLTENRITFKDIETFGTPRRLALVVKGASPNQEDIVTEFKGPKWSQAFDANGNPTKAATGFARSKGVDFEELESREINGVQYAVATKSEKGRSSEEVFPELLPAIIRGINFPKSMYWNDPSFRFARPIRWILALYGEKLINFEYGNIKSDRTTRGHRFMGSRSIEIKDASNYLDRLYDNYVIVDQHKRKEKMLSGISLIEKDLSGKADKREELIDENLFLVEFPVPFSGNFDESFLELPEEVLTTTMIHHQKYFPVRDENGRLMSSFIGVSNNRAANMKVVKEGNERVLKARLSDAAFFWNEDLKKPLNSRVEELKNIVYQEQSGSLYDKVMHTRNIAAWLCDQCCQGDLLNTVKRAAYLAKSDLVSSMVYEFPELQGTIGREYALKNGESEEVALALEEQYLPRFSGDRLPSGYAGAILGIAERTYNMVSSFKAGLQVTGSQDPYGLRRSARSINEIIWGLELDPDMNEVFQHASKELEASEKVSEEVREFYLQRLFMQFKEKGYSHEMVQMSMSVISSRPFQVARLLETLNSVKDEDWFSSLATSAVRVKNILSKNPTVTGDVNPDLLTENAEKELYSSVQQIAPRVEESVANFKWKDLTIQLSDLSPAVTSFFDSVLVMAEDESVRENRLALLNTCHKLLKKAGDLGSLNM